MVGSTVQHGFSMILQRGTGTNSDFSNRGIEVVVSARRNGFQATTPRISAPKTRDYTTPNKRLSQKHGGLKRWWSQNVNPSSIPRFVANFAGGHFARSKLRGACRCPASWKRGGEGEPAQVRYGLSQGDWAPWWMVISIGSTCGDKFEFGQRWFQAKHGFSMFQRVWKQKHGIQFLDDLTNTTNGLKLPKGKRQMMVGFWVGVANRVFEPLKMPVGRQYICGSQGFQFSPIGRIFRRSMWPAWPGLESHHCRFWNTQRNRSGTWDVHEWNKASTGKGKKQSSKVPFPVISSHLQDRRRMNETG